jgi:site-specific recombinase XerD
MDERGVQPQRLSLVDAYAYQGYQLARLGCRSAQALSKRTVCSYVVAANTFAAWLYDTGRALDNPFAVMRRCRPERRLLLQVPKEAELDTLLADLATWPAKGNLKRRVRHYLTHVIAEVQYASGLRIAELANLRPQDIDFDRAILTVRDGKKGSNRLAFLNDYARDVLELYCTDLRPLLCNGQHQANADRLFLSGFDRLGHVQNDALAAAVGRVGGQRLTTHGFRHALGYHLLRAGCNLRHIQAILGHASIKDTELYTKVDVETVRATLDTCHPRA